jgi:tetratricopeptide (TPR) repeat protein
MGRFSRLETGQTGASIDPIVSDEIRPSDGVSAADYATQDAAGCIDHGDRLLFMDERRQALRWYSRAVDLDSTRMDGWTRMILTLLMHGDLGEAAAWIARSLTVYPESPCLLALRAVEYARRGMIRQAMAATDSAIERAGNDPIAYLARGEVLLLAENKNASYCFDQAAKIVSPDD